MEPSDPSGIERLRSVVTGRFTGTERFELRRRLGQGGMGIVYEAWDRHRERLVALKTLRRMEPKDLLRFKNEYRLLRDLHHPNLIELGELVEHEGNWFFTMELIDGVNVVRYTGKSREARQRDADRAAANPDPFAKRPGRCDPARLRRCLHQLAEGLRALHATNAVHRDIKPSNVMVTPEGRVVLLDLGLAIVSGRDDMESKVNVAAGTSEYMAPEQAAAKPVGPEADWYSVGVVMFQALTGRVPFTGPHLEISVRKLQEDPPRPSDFCCDIPPDLDELCFRLLSREPADRPMGAQIIQAVDGGRAGTAPPESHGTTFVGRDAELEQLESSLERALSGRLVSIAVRGESGVGKSALLTEFAERTKDVFPSLVTLSGRCYQREWVPYNAIDEIMDMLVRSLTRTSDEELAPLLSPDLALAANVFPVLRRLRPVARRRPPSVDGIESRELRARMFEAIRQLVVRVAQARPMVVAVEDIQWADDESRALLDYIFRSQFAGACLLLTTEWSDGEAGRAWRGPGAEVIELEALPIADAEEVVRRLMPWDSRAADIARASSGHPLLLRELMRHIGPDSALPEQAVRPEELMWQRIQTLDDGVRRVLELLALAGAPLRQEVAAYATDLPFPELADVVETLRRENLVRTSGVRRSDVVDVFHAQIRAAIVSQLDAVASAALHENLALALEASGATDDEALARHWHVAGSPLKARDYALRAGEAAADAFAYDRAARLYQMALDLADENTPEASQRRVQSKLADVYASSGRAVEAARGYLAAAAGSGDVAALELRRRAAEQLLCSGHIDEGMPVLEGVLEGVGLTMPKSPRRAIASMLARRALRKMRGLRYTIHPASAVSIQSLRRIDVTWSTVLGIGAVDHRYAPLFQIRHLDEALRAGEPYRLVRALSLECLMMGAAGIKTQPYVRQVFEHIDTLLEHTDRPHAEGFATVARGVVYAMWGQWAEARDILERGEALLRDRCSGVSREIALARQFLFAVLTFLGEFEELGRTMPAAVRDAEERGDLYAATAYRLGAQSQLWLALDDEEAAREHAEAALAPWQGPAFLVQHYQGLVTNAQNDLYAGDAERAWGRFAEAWQGLRSGHILRMQFARIVVGYLRARAAVMLASRAEDARNRDEYLKAARGDARRLESEGVPYAVLFSKLVRAGIASVGDKLDTAEEILDAAANLAGETGFAPHCAAAEYCLGGLRQGEEGAELMEVAERTLREQGIKNPAKFVRLLIPGFE